MISARQYVRTVAAVHHRCIYGKSNLVGLLIQRSQVLLDILIKGGLNDELPALAHGANLALLDNDFPALDDVAGILEHDAAAWVLVIQGHVRVSTRAKVSLLRESQRARRSGGGDDRDFGQRV